MEKSDVIFRAIRGEEANLLKMNAPEGAVLFATDTGKMWMIANGERVTLSGGTSGAAVLYGVADTKEANEDGEYEFYLSELEDKDAKPKAGDLILNQNGTFFKITSYDSSKGIMYCDLIAVSGSGGGEGGGVTVRDVNVEWNKSTINTGSTYVYGKEYYALFTPTTTAEGDTTCTLIFRIIETQNGNKTTTITKNNLRSGAVYKFNTAQLPIGQDIKLEVVVLSDNSEYHNGEGWLRSITGINVVSMNIEKDPTIDYIPIVTPDAISRTQTLRYIPRADSSLTLTRHVYIDGVEDLSLKKNLEQDDYNVSNSVTIQGQEHGVHTIGIAISSNLNGEDIYSDIIEYEAAWAVSGNENPIIWIGNYDETIINYETSYIKFMVYDPQATSSGSLTTLILYKENVEVGQMDVEYSPTTWLTWDISDLYTVGNNNWSITCRTAKADISNYVTTVGSRNLGLAEVDSLMINYTTAGRSNNEVISQRTILKDKITNSVATLSGFNWKNNGWNNDGPNSEGIDNGSYLTIANGASVEIPFQNITLNSDKNYSIEMRFRVRNVQEYSTLVQTLPMYFYNSNGSKSEDSKLLSDIEELGLEVWRDEWGNMVMDEENTQKIAQTEKGVICSWLNTNNMGLCIGSQEAYFRSPRGIVSVRYKEDEVINISIVISKDDGLVYIYLNGILSGADSLPAAGGTGAFVIQNNFRINSNYCDVDLYRFRIYQYGLTMPNVIHNYLSDIHNIALYDQNQLTKKSTELDYELLIAYNKAHPDKQTMPYSVWKVTTAGRDEKLPCFKGDEIKVDITFINPVLDYALETGLIDEWYYYTHCPSCKAEGVDVNVQGTSSQGYPRRNFKTKYKKATSWVFYNLIEDETKRGSLWGKNVAKAATVLDRNGNEHTLTKNFHMDNEDIGTNKFTWKIDYMESSGSYNTGFANLMGNLSYPLYTKHPLSDVKDPNTGEPIVNTDKMRTSVYGFPLLVFHEYEDSTKNPTNSTSKYEYIGRYNMNLDKSSNEYYGFEESVEQPYLTWEKTVPVTDPETGEPIIDLETGEVQTTIEYYHPKIKECSECWELEDNQGTWCSFKYPNASARNLGFQTKQAGTTDKLECMLHFEYRYSPYGDQLDAIGADGHYDGVVPDDKPEIGQQIGSTNAEKSAYAYNVYKNLERVFNWVDSTDTTNATNATLAAAAGPWKTSKPYSADGETSIPVSAYIAVTPGTPFDESETYYLLDEQTGEYNEINIDKFTEGIQYYIYTISYYNTTFTKDTEGYRLEKFRNEFALHFDKEYCMVYFILTELLLCYDSRGKNMMMTTFGPHEVGGDYIWYPTFYDIDTQLGLNNSGAYLWDYDADVTTDGLFSTPTSTLWVNLWAAFEEDIKNKYRVLRGLNDGSRVVNSLTYNNIAGAYECNGQVFNSYAMRGLRPIIAIGLDEYYKYFATTTASGVGYFDTHGDLIKEASPTYAYACQGDKILTTELLLRNRLNYIDSWWLGGDYYIAQVKAGELQCRVSGNRFTLTSDNYLDVSDEMISNLIATNESYNNTNLKKATYPVPYYDARPGYQLKPFLKQYVTYFTDEVPSNPVKYTADPDTQVDGVWTEVSASTENSYKTQKETPNEQLNYIPGLDYLSSLGDLSTSYISEFSLRKGKRLLDLRLGSDAPGYKNAMIRSNTIFGLYAGAADSGKKSLLKFVNLTGLTSLDKTIDITGSEKLQEFRALRTNIPNVYFADGAPLHTVHLPSTIQTLSLVENKDLTRILTTRPVVADLVNGVLTYENADSYKGLYIEGITDYNESINANAGHGLNAIVINGGGLGYDSYKILKNIVGLKRNASSNNTCQIGMLNSSWTPYTQLENGETYNSDNASIYYELNDHSMFNPFVWTNLNDWNEKLLNGLIYTYDSTADINTITSLDLLDLFVENYNSDKANNRMSQFSMKDATSEASVPTLSGTLYVNNTQETAINEVDLTDIYKPLWPNLTIQAKYVNIANLCKYVRVYDNGKIETLTVERTSGNTPLYPTGNAPTQTYYDFQGWSTDNPTKVADPVIALRFNPDYSSTGTMYEETEAWDALNFDNETTVITFYAIFKLHKFDIEFVNGDGSSLVQHINFNEVLTGPDPTEMVVYKDDSLLPFDRTYHFDGWSLDPDGDIVKLNSFRSTRDYKFYSVFSEDSVYNNTVALDPFVISEVTYTGNSEGSDPSYRITGFDLKPKAYGVLKGKITFPNEITYNGKTLPLVSISGENAQLPNSNGAGYITQGFYTGVTHVFFENAATSELRIVRDNAFSNNVTLKFFEMPIKLRYIESYAFSNDPNLLVLNFENSPILRSIGTEAFNQSLTSDIKNSEGYAVLNITLPGSVEKLGRYCFANAMNAGSVYNTFTIGSEENGSQLILEQISYSRNNGSNSEINSLVIHFGNDPNRETYFEMAKEGSGETGWPLYINAEASQAITGANFFLRTNAIGCEIVR